MKLPAASCGVSKRNSPKPTIHPQYLVFEKFHQIGYYHIEYKLKSALNRLETLAVVLDFDILNRSLIIEFWANHNIWDST
jgi:hypothetical protein